MPQNLLKRAQTEGTPLIDGDKATFVWRGPDAPRLVGDINRWNARDPIELRRVAPDMWTHTVKLLRDAYIEYALVCGDQRVPDPFNANVAPNGHGGLNHYFYMSGGPTPLIQRQRGVRRGIVSRHVIESDLFFGNRRAIYLYQPPTDQPSPLIVVFDGRDYLRRVRLPDIVDNLIAQGRMRPVALALIDHGGPARIQEYSASEATIAAVLTKALPLAKSQLRLTEPGDYGVLGASLGGLLALSMGLRYPKIFNRVLSQSGSFTLRGHETLVFDLVRAKFNQRAKIWLDVGRYELLKSANRHLRDWLATMNYDATYREFHGGHNYPAWRDDVWRGLEALFQSDH
jgi:enterochelin esterase family protein